MGSRRARNLALIALVAIGLTYLVAVAIFVSAETPTPREWFTAVGDVVWVTAFSTVGFLVVSRSPGNPIGPIALGFGAVWTLWLLCDGLLSYEVTHPGSIPRPDLIAALSYPLWVPGVALVALLLLVFPTGTLPSPRWRPAAWVLGITVALLFATGFLLPGEVQDQPYMNPLGVEGFEFFDEGPGGIVLVLTLMASLAAAAFSVLVRFRRSRGIERLQLKWLVAASLLSAVGYAALFLVEFEVQLVWATIPVAIGFAMHRHRLYDIDRLVSRAVSYAIVVALLATLYVAVVFLLGSLAPFEGDLAVAAATLAAFAVFAPLRRRVQTTVERRFNRRRYDSARVAAALTGELREQTDAAIIVGRWASLVAATMQPAALGLWLSEGDTADG